MSSDRSRRSLPAGGSRGCNVADMVGEARLYISCFLLCSCVARRSLALPISRRALS